jgi:uncharacterized protein CbrC (UPF0167 family)
MSKIDQFQNAPKLVAYFKIKHSVILCKKCGQRRSVFYKYSETHPPEICGACETDVT